MFLKQLALNFFIFIVGLFGIIYNRRNMLILLMCIELMLLSINLNFIIFSYYLEDIYGQIFSLSILTIAAAESAIGLALIIIYNSLFNKIMFKTVSILRY